MKRCHLFSEILTTTIFCDDITEWHIFKKENSIFFKMVSNRIGYNAATLYSIAKVLNSLGKETFFSDGIDWISTIVNNNTHLIECSLPINTLYLNSR